jgi:hypothetical protein
MGDPAREEGFRFGALLTGPLNWKNHLKVGVFLVIILVWVLIIYGGMNLVGRFRPKKVDIPTSAHTAGPTTVQSQGGAVIQVDDHSSEPRTISYTINEAPFGNGLFGAFGSKGKTEVKENAATTKRD